MNRRIYALAFRLLLASTLIAAPAAGAACDPAERYPRIEECDGPAVIVVAPLGGQYCSGDADECSGRILVAGVIVGNGSKFCGGNTAACNDNLVFVSVMIGDDSSACFAGQRGAAPDQ